MPPYSDNTGPPPFTKTTTTTKTELSLLYRILRVVIQALRPHLVKPGNPLPAGSPRLTKRPKAKNGCTIIERLRGEMWCYDFLSPAKLVDLDVISHSRHRIYYFAGGGFQSTPSREHWSFVSWLASHPELSKKLSITLVSYPLAPNTPAGEALPKLREFLAMVIGDAACSGQTITLMGDSAGGNIVLSLGFWWAQQLSSATTAARLDLLSEVRDARSPLGDFTKADLQGILTNLVVISPVCDHRNTNPSILAVNKDDPLLGFDMIESCSRAWTTDPPTTNHLSNTARVTRVDPTISPVLHLPSAYEAVKMAGINIHGIVGTSDVLAPDALIFRDKCAETGIFGEWLVWEGQMHCFPLAGVYGMKEGKFAMKWINHIVAKF